MSVKLLDHHVHSHDCQSRLLCLGVCLQCLTVCFTTAYHKSVRCCKCHKWLQVQREVLTLPQETWSRWYQASLRSEIDFILDNFMRNKLNVLNRLEERRQMSLPGLGKVEL